MALDTRDKRDSAIGLGLPWRVRFPVPDGSLASGADRQHVALLYRGIAVFVESSQFPAGGVLARVGPTGKLARRGPMGALQRVGPTGQLRRVQ